MIKKLRCILFSLVFASEILIAQSNTTTINTIGQRWSIEKANSWYNSHRWLSGANYIPHTAINQLEMWQADTFDSATIKSELSLAKQIGFNTMRVFLHSKVWQTDSTAFLRRISSFLRMAQVNDIKPMFVFFDDVWNKEPKPGKQPEPKPGIHNSGWMQDPGQPASSDSSLFPQLERYVKGVLTHFAHDKRILMWDLYNEPGNSGKADSSLPLLTKVITWAREVNPEQPITIGLWAWNLEQLNAVQFLNSDIITYHNYEDPQMHKRTIELLKVGGRPLICTEYMARTRNSRFSNILPLLKQEKVGAINWGFVEGKTNTIYAWDTPIKDGGQPIEWFHDIFWRNGKPYRDDEVALIKKMNEVN